MNIKSRSIGYNQLLLNYWKGHHMEESASSLALENAKDFSMIINKMVKHLGWKQKEAEAACSLYRNFLFLHKKYGHEHSLPPSEEIDEFWHNHILDTKKYRQDCQVIFGRYLDHYPYFGIDGKTNLTDLNHAFETTQQFHQQEFGYRIERIKKLKLCEIISIVIQVIKASWKKIITY